MSDSSAQASGLAERYASALFDLAKEQDARDPVGADLDDLVRLAGENPDLRRLIASPVIGREAQARAVVAVAERAGAHDLTRKFLGVLAGKGRLFALPDVARAFRARAAKDRGEVAAEVVSAVPLDEGQLKVLNEAVSRQAGRAVTLAASVDPGLIGGLVVRIGSRMIDASLRTKIARLETSLKGIG